MLSLPYFGLIALCMAAVGGEVRDDGREIEFFEKRIRPLLIQHCYDCHGPDLAEGRLRLDIKSGWERGGERGPAIVPGDPAASLLILAVSHRDQKLKMPPVDAADKLSDAEIGDLIHWIRQGATDPRDGESVVTDIEVAAAQHWAFQAVAPPAVPTDVHPIDYLIDRQLERQSMLAAPPAEMPILIRRAVYDLTGLPPTAQQLATPRQQFPQLVQELLASPRYGERWGRHWLDVARYADAKDGVLMYGDARIRPFAYTYRDYVIRAFNDDKPLDQFIREQLAADHLPLPPDAPKLAALGLLTLGRMFDNNLHDVVDDQIDVVGRGFLGLSLACARCHDHKFDPVPTADYYSLYGVFASSVVPLELPRIGPVSEAGQAFEDQFAAKLQEVTSQQQAHYEDCLQTARQRTPDYLVHVATIEPDVSETTVFFLSLVPDQLRPQITRRWRQTIARRAFPDDPVFGPWHDLMKEPIPQPQRWLERGTDPRIVEGLVAANPQTPAEVARAYGEIIVQAWRDNPVEEDPLAGLLLARDGPVWFPIRDVANYLSRIPADAFRGLTDQLDAIAVAHAQAAPRAMVVEDAEVLCDPVIFLRGDPAVRGTPVDRRFLQVLSPDPGQHFDLGSGRLELANAIASADNPLTARVWVNRVWMHHFGQSLVDDPGDFGLQSPRPVHLELLDFLADYLVQSGWRTKPLHQLIMSSQAYQRSSLVGQENGEHWEAMSRQLETDPDNAFYWRVLRRRLDFEQMRDSLLMVAGQLDEGMYGRPRPLTDEDNHRRTVYGFVERQNIPDMVRTFDFANADTATPRRTETTVPQQALFALNSHFMLVRADAVAQRCADQGDADANGDVDVDVDRDESGFVQRLYRMVLGRQADDQEVAWCVQFLQQGSRAQLAQVLLMSNEFIFID